MPTLEDVQIKIKSTADTGGVDKSSAALDRFDSRVSSLKSGLETGLKVAVGSSVAAFTALATSSITTAAKFEQFRVSFDVMLGSADKAKKLLADITKFAKETPFELDQVVEGSKKLLAFGVSGDKVIETFRTLGNIAAGVGADKLPALVNVFGQVRAAGRLMSQDLLQFTSAGVPVLELLGKKYNASGMEVKKMVEEGKVSFNDLSDALDTLGGKHGAWADLMDRQSHTLNGTISNLKDSFTLFGLSIAGVTNQGEIIKGGFFDKVKEGAAVLFEKINQNQQAITDFGAKIGDFIVTAATKLIDAIVTISNFYKDHKDLINNEVVPAMKALIELFVILQAKMLIGEGVAAFQAGMKALQLSAMASTGQLTSLSAGIAALPLAITVGVALVGYELIKKQIDGLKGDLDTLSQSKDRASQLDASILQQAKDAKAKGDTAKADKLMSIYNTPAPKGADLNWFQKLLTGVDHFATGVQNYKGGMALVGEQGPELVNLPQGSSVIPNHQMNQMGGGMTIHQTNHIYNQTDTLAAARELAFQLAM